ncbi:hypothetical protein [Mucilaginibacter sp. CSA2-8R]|uniref:hypothetical protein n=1 Tax=Mucilaginibacter sp. CSA2-8R TaxID=3141542 RepID=UPI00315D5CCC
MQKTLRNYFKGYWLIITATLFVLCAFTGIGGIILQDEPMGFKPADYYIANVIDERSNKSNIAQLINLLPGNKLYTGTQQLDLQGGAATAVGKFINHNLPQNKSLKAVNIIIKEFKLTETPMGASRIDGQLKLRLAFGLEKDYGTQLLVEYKGGLHYVRSINSVVAIEPYLRSSLKSSLQFFNNWMQTNQTENAKLAQNVKIIFNDYTENAEGDTIYYTANRPLSWKDFQGKAPNNTPYAAGVMPSIGYNQHAKVVNGTIIVYVDMKTSLPKSTCWAKPFAKDDYNLNHEQRHFDIAQIIAGQFKQKILAQQLTPDNYEAIINMQYLDSYRDLYEMQKAYDKETGNGTRQQLQQEWNEKIDKQLLTKASSTAAM